MPRICVIGSANLDFTVALPRLPRVGETVSAGTLLVNRGGKGANQAVAARRLGAEVRMIGCVGDDDSGQEIRRALREQGIGVDAIATSSKAGCAPNATLARIESLCAASTPSMSKLGSASA